jgi:hypothetical protein
MARIPLLLTLSFPLLSPSIAQAAAAQGSRYYVDASASGANDGSSWTNAFTDLGPALALAVANDEVWVAAGTYRPSTTGNRSDIFAVLGAKVYGGFAGTEISLANRAGLFDQTILSGDLNGDDGPGFANTSDNSFHVVDLSGELDGFTISGGNAENADGGAILIGIFVSATVENCVLQRNQADGNGGAVWSYQGELSTFRRCTFLGNRAGGRGGAAYADSMDWGATFENCRFLGNVAAHGGGAFGGNLWGLFMGCDFSGNSADGPASQGGGAILLWWPESVNCTFYGNTAVGSPGGGAVRTLQGSFFQSSILWGNVDDSGHGEAAQISAAAPSAPHYVLTCCVEGWTGSLDDSPGNLHADPRFADPAGADGIVGTRDDDLRLLLGSPAVDTGSPWTHAPPLPTEDMDGEPRFFDALACDGGGVLDMGAHERATADGTTGYCLQPPTSLGVPAEISAPCLVDVAAGAIPFRVGPVSSKVGLLFFGPHVASVPYGPGGIDRLCAGGSLRRLPSMTRTGRSLSLLLDLADPRAAALVPGSSWHFQALFRDAGILRLSDATTITFRD